MMMAHIELWETQMTAQLHKPTQVLNAPDVYFPRTSRASHQTAGQSRKERNPRHARAKNEPSGTRTQDHRIKKSGSRKAQRP